MHVVPRRKLSPDTANQRKRVTAIFWALLTHPWVFVLWFAAFCGVLLITAGLIGSSR
jgi:hypothetical protein